MSLQTALRICLLFGTASLLSIGGGNSVVPEMQLKAVHAYHWLTDAQFADIFAIAQVAPGPSILIVTLIGYQAAGILGAPPSNMGSDRLPPGSSWQAAWSWRAPPIIPGRNVR